MKLTEFIPLRPNSNKFILLADAAVSAGEPCEIPDDFEQCDINEYLTNGKDGVYLIRVVGDSMEAEIFHGDQLIVNRNLQAEHGDKIIASVGGSFTVKIFSQSPREGLRLVAKNGKYKPRKILPKDDFEIFGVVTHVIRKLKKN